MKRAQAYSFIAKVLALKNDANAYNALPAPFPVNENEWQMVVKTASDNLVLPSFYHKLYKAQLLHLLPDELAAWSKSIYQLNLKRNNNILSQSLAVNQLLLQNEIRCIFMKGVANLMGDLYDGAGERMLYDIDILVRPEQLLCAANVLQSSGYHPVKPFNVKSLSSTMHYPLLVREGMVAGVEIHRLPTQYHYTKIMSNDEIFDDSMPAKGYGDFRIMGLRHRVIHNFVHTQLMHDGHYHANIALRDLYDLYLLGDYYPLNLAYESIPRYRGHAGAYLDLMQGVFGVDEAKGQKGLLCGISLRWRHRQVLRLSDYTLRLYHSVIFVCQKYLVLPIRVLWNPVARNYVFTRLLDRQWYATHFRAMKGRISKKRLP